MKAKFNLIVILFYFFFMPFLCSHDCISFSEAKNLLEGHPKKPITVIEENISLEEAYCAQDKFNYLLRKRYNDKIGYKVGFTGKALQERFNISTPAVGTLYEHMFLKNNAVISKDFGYRTFIEPDIMVVIKSSNIMNAKTEIELLKEISTVHPFLEIPVLRYEKEKKINGNMIIAANMLATKMIMAEGIRFQSNEQGIKKLSNLNTILLDKDNKIIQISNTKNLMGNPLKVLMWLITEFNKKQIVLKKGDRISLGSVGKIFPLTKNTYKYYFEGFEDKKNVINLVVN